MEASIHFIYDTDKKDVFIAYYIIITLIRHICNIFMLKKVNRSDLGPIDQCFDIFGPLCASLIQINIHNTKIYHTIPCMWQSKRDREVRCFW